MKPKALYASPLTDLHAGGPAGMFASNDNVIERLFGALEEIHENIDTGSAGRT